MGLTPPPMDPVTEAELLAAFGPPPPDSPPSVPAAPAVSLREQWEAIKEMAAYAEMEWGETSDTGEKGGWESLSRRLRAAAATLRDVEAKENDLRRGLETIRAEQDIVNTTFLMAGQLLSRLAERTAL